MNSRELDREKLNNQLHRLEEYVQRLESIKEGGKDQFLGYDVKQGATERYLQIVIETILNIGNHIIAARGLRLPQEYSDIFRILGEAGVLDSAVVSRYVEMARFRNRLVHMYWKVDEEEVWKILENDLGDVRAFARTIVKLIGDK